MKYIEDGKSLDSIGARIRNERENLGLSRENFAEIVELSSFYIGQIERDERNMSLDSLVKICDTLNVSIDYILRGKAKYLEGNTISETIDIYTSKEIDDETKEILNLLSRVTKENLITIKNIIKILIPQLRR